jgi:hypothetical protein
MTAIQDRLVLWHGENVSVGEVLDALDGIRNRFAHEEADEGEHLHPRNCVMTLISIAPDDSREENARRTTLAIGTEHPAQAIVIREWPPSAGRLLDAWITSDPLRPKAPCGFECEFITLHVYGAAADHLAPLLDPLLVSGVPTYLWWLGTPPFGKAEILDALRVCDGLVVDSAHFQDPYHAFHRMSAMLKVAHHRMGLGDLQWARLRPWRENIAQFFTPSDRRQFLGGISEVGVDYAGEGRGNRIAAALITGWMASALDWKLRRAKAGTGGVVVAHYESAGRTIEVEFRSMPKEGLASGEVTAVRMAGTAGGATFRLSVQRDPARSRGQVTDFPERRRGDTGQVLLTMIEIGDSEPLRHVQQLEPEDDAALLLDLLSTGTHDEVFNRSLQAAAQLMETV